MLYRLREIFANCCVKWRCALVEFGGESDHVQLLIDGHPSMNLARMIGNKYFWKVRFWNNAYAVVSAGGQENIETLLAYIQDQEKPSC